VGQDRRGRAVGAQVWIALPPEIMGQPDHVEGDTFDLQRHIHRPRPFLGEVPLGAPRFDVLEIGVRIALDQLLSPQAELVGSLPRTVGSVPSLDGEQRGLLQQRRADRDCRGRRRSARGRRLWRR
jgi:hypothetical protein